MKKSVRVWIAFLAGICILWCDFALLSVHAETMDVQVEPRLTFISSCRANLTISSDGVASISGNVTGKTGVTHSYVKATLQKEVSGSWIDVESWENSSDRRSVTVAATYQVSKGTYRVFVECSANGETSSTTSATKTY